MTTRGGAVESIHYGSVAVADADGELLYAAGDPDFLTFTRSALKPLQAMPFAARGGAARYGFGPPELALMCASHSGEPQHVEVVAGMLERIDCRADDLQCGVHPPYFYRDRGEIPPPVPFSPLQHNCSGKHAGMLAYCRLCQLPIDHYLAYAHPLQQAIRRSVAHFTGVPEDRLVYGVDGCSAPNYAVPLLGLAQAYARIARDEADAEFGHAPELVFMAMTSHPELVSGTLRNDNALMLAGQGDWVAKVGAEGVQAVGLRGRGWGIAIKVADGAERALHPATIEVLDQLGVLDATQRAELAAWRFPEIRNLRGAVTGGIAPAVAIERA